MAEGYMRASADDIVARDPINVALNPAEGFEGVQSVIQLRWMEADIEQGRPQSGIDATINTVFRVGPKTKPRIDIRQQVVNHHRELVSELFNAIHKAPKKPGA